MGNANLAFKKIEDAIKKLNNKLTHPYPSLYLREGLEFPPLYE